MLHTSRDALPRGPVLQPRLVFTDLVRFSARRPMSLILPSLFSELEGPALAHIVDEIARVPYLAELEPGQGGDSRPPGTHGRGRGA